MRFLTTFIVLLVFASCNKNTKSVPDDANTKPVAEEVTPVHERPVSVDNGKFFSKMNKDFLYGGKDSLQHFDITNYDLKNEQFHYGIGREVFPALLKPEFNTLEEASKIWNDSTRFLLAHSGKDVKAYSVKDLTRHEVVNDVLDGKPIMAAYCVLADLGAVYDRNYNGRELTFALSGYTYYDKNVWDGLDGFVLWDRETESLWWPLIGKAVSGKLKGVRLIELNESLWEDTTWKEIKKKYPTVKVLKSGQDFERPKSWKKYDDVSDIVEIYSAKK